jgi:hypothetical protein
MIQRLTVGSKLKGLRPGGGAKASAKCATQLSAVDPKPSDLAMSRLKQE